MFIVENSIFSGKTSNKNLLFPQKLTAKAVNSDACLASKANVASAIFLGYKLRKQSLILWPLSYVNFYGIAVLNLKCSANLLWTKTQTF